MYFTNTYTHTIWHVHAHTPGVPLCPNMPLKKQGMRMLPPISDPIPITEPPLLRILPSPPSGRRVEEKHMHALLHHSHYYFIRFFKLKSQVHIYQEYKSSIYLYIHPSVHGCFCQFSKDAFILWPLTPVNCVQGYIHLFFSIWLFYISFY